ncbi:hypothetical protein C2I18_03190 [Paenibacillus sp. PK3_47]|uniref:LacI family DNA-binding transcriptional regulator n=1 Tax=Paenibacillus sp. PK3_47 TaxID=2072642 RepID=UPI00201D9BEB|nr:LacI family DNA-binding transcriptional regulator [Paenibacillus sp. PK3_47]UQZ32650.1 hypothetical protein C2I18_03190 [Paenibacillus sp. PK3_47]
MTVTIKHVARRAGVSSSTVSRVISGYPNVREETSRRVKKAMEDMGYTPNIIAKNLVRSRAGSICILLPQPAEKWFGSLFMMELIRGVVTGASLLGFDLLVGTGDGEQEKLEAVSRLLRGRQADGAIVLSTGREKAVVDFLEDGGYPFIQIGRSGKEELELQDLTGLAGLAELPELSGMPELTKLIGLPELCKPPNLPSVPELQELQELPSLAAGSTDHAVYRLGSAASRTLIQRIMRSDPPAGLQAAAPLGGSFG